MKITIDDLLVTIHLLLMNQEKGNPVFNELNELTFKLKERGLDKLSVDELPFWKALMRLIENDKGT